MSNIRVVNLSTYTAPKITEEKNKDFVSYGQDNNYYQYFKTMLCIMAEHGTVAVPNQETAIRNKAPD